MSLGRTVLQLYSVRLLLLYAGHHLLPSLRYSAWYTYKMLAQITMRTCGVNMQFDLFKAYIYIDSSVKL